MKQDETPSRPLWFKRKYWLHHPIQKEFSIYFPGLFVIVQSGLYIALRNQHHRVLAACSGSADLSTCQQAMSAFGGSMGFLMAIVGGVGAVVMACGAILLTHRIVGPMIRLSQELERIEKGDGGKGPPLQFRKDDYFADLVSRLNQVLKK